MPTIKTNDVEISYRTFGIGPDVVMIHGLAANQAFWLPTAMQLASRFRITAFDLPGHGYSQTPAAGYTPSEIAEVVADLIVRVGIADCHLVGHSFGGLIGLGVAIRHRALLRSLSVVDTRVGVLQPYQPMRDIPEFDQLAAAIRRAGVPLGDDEPELGFCLLEALATRGWRERFRRLASSDGGAPFLGGKGSDRSAERWLRLMRTTAARQEIRTPLGISQEDLQTLKIPVLGCYGARSPNLVTLRGLAAHIPNMRVRVIEGAGHYFPLTHQEIMAEECSLFLDLVEMHQPTENQEHFSTGDLGHEHAGRERLATPS